MTESDIRRIESSVGFLLPVEYRRFLLEHARAIPDLKRKARQQGLFGVYPYSTIEGIVSSNTGDRTWMRIGAEGDDQPFADHVVFIADNGGGDYYFVYRASNDQGVWLWDHECQSARLVQRDLKSYFESFDVHVDKPWWKFW